MPVETKINITKTGNTVTVSGGGELDLMSAGEFGEGLREASQTGESVVIDLKDTLFIDTAVVQYIANAFVKMRDRGKRLKVIVAEGSYPQHVVKTVGFDQLMDVVAE